MPYVRALGADSVTGSVPVTTGLPETVFGPPPVTQAEKSAYAAQAAKQSSGGGFWDTIKSALVGGVTAYGSGLAQKNQAGQSVVVQQSSPTEKWLPWIVVGMAGVAVAVIVKNRKK